MNDSGKNTFVLLISFAVGVIQAWGVTEYYVAAMNGNDVSNPGSMAAPFKTISKAAAVMNVGDRCFIREGIYRETVTITKDELYFGAYSNEHVVVSGCDLVESPWTVYSGDIMQTTVTNQVLQLFSKGQRRNLARYPNEDSSQNMFSINEWEESETIPVSIVGIGTNEVSFPNMPSTPAGYWVGGYYTGKNGSNPFSAAVGKIIASSSSSTITIDDLAYWPRNASIAGAGVGTGYGYIINHINALDVESEWYWDNNILYYYPASVAETNSGVVEVRSRMLGFVMDGSTGTTMENIHLQAASLSMADTTNGFIKGCSIRYPAPWSDFAYPSGHSYGGVDDGSAGVFVSGLGNVLTNSYIAHSWGSGLRLDGTNNLAVDSIIEDVDWCGRRMSGVQLLGNFNKVTGCTIRKCGRDGIDGGNYTVGFGQYGRYSEVTHCRIEDTGYLTSDNGGYYINLQGVPAVHLTLAYNEILRNHATLYSSGIFIDNGTSFVTIHHNLVVGPHEFGIFLNDSGLHKIDNAIIANNTIWDTTTEFGVKAWHPYAYSPTNIYVANNLVESNLVLFSSILHSSNVPSASLVEFVNPAINDFHLVGGSVYEDGGVEIAGITDGYTGSAPDLGAYESGQIWTAGSTNPIPPDYTAVDTDGDGLSDILETNFGSDPLDPDTNGDGTSDAEDYRSAGMLSAELHLYTATYVQFQFDTLNNWHHSIEFTEDLLSNNWISVAENIMGTGDSRQVFIDTSSPTGFLNIKRGLLPLAENMVFYDGFEHYSPPPYEGQPLHSVNGIWGSSLVALRTEAATGLAAESGIYHLIFTGTTGGGSITFSIETQIGQTYGVSCALARFTSSQPSPHMRMSAAGMDAPDVVITAPAGTWQYAGFSFVATNSETAISFYEPNINTLSQAPLLDSVSVFKLFN